VIIGYLLMIAQKFSGFLAVPSRLKSHTSHLLAAVPSRLSSQAFSPASGSLISIESLMGPEASTSRNALVWGLMAGLRFHW
jgi:hypothetical protein